MSVLNPICKSEV